MFELNNFEKIKQMNIEGLAELFKQKQCEECPYQPDWQECEQLDCWVKGDTYLNWLKSDE